MIQDLVESQEGSEARDYFIKLKGEVESDRKLLEKLLESAGLEPSGTLKVAGKVAGRIGMWKMKWEGFEPGELGMFEALEALTLGIEGKRLLWRGAGRDFPVDSRVAGHRLYSARAGRRHPAGRGGKMAFGGSLRKPRFARAACAPVAGSNRMRRWSGSPVSADLA